MMETRNGETPNHLWEGEEEDEDDDNDKNSKYNLKNNYEQPLNNPRNMYITAHIHSQYGTRSADSKDDNVTLERLPSITHADTTINTQVVHLCSVTFPTPMPSNKVFVKPRELCSPGMQRPPCSCVTREGKGRGGSSWAKFVYFCLRSQHSLCSRPRGTQRSKEIRK